MANVIKIKRGYAENIENAALTEGEIAVGWNSDKSEGALYVGNGDGYVEVAKNVVSGVSSDDLDAEATAREEADTTLQSNIDTHAATGGSAVTLAHVKLSASTSSSSGVSACTAATPSAVKSAYDRASTAITNAAAVQTNLDTEVSAREEADAALQTAIDAKLDADADIDGGTF